MNKISLFIWLVLWIIFSLLGLWLYQSYQTHKNYTYYQYLPDMPDFIVFHHKANGWQIRPRKAFNWKFYTNYENIFSITDSLDYDGSLPHYIVSKNNKWYLTFLIEQWERHIYDYDLNFWKSHTNGMRVEQGEDIRVCLLSVDHKRWGKPRITPLSSEKHCQTLKAGDNILFDDYKENNTSDTIRVVVQGNIDKTAYTVFAYDPS